VKLRAGHLVAAALGLAWAGMALWQSVKPLPPGTRVASAPCSVPAASLGFTADVTAADAYGHAVLSQGVFEQVLQVVRGAHRFIVLDYHLIDADEGSGAAQRPLAGALTDALLAQRQANPQLRVLFITDPVNEHYGAAPAAQLQLLRAAGVAVVLTDLDALRDPNFLYSALWRLTVRWWAGDSGFGAAARRLNFKADHRKLVIADDGSGQLVAVVGTANPADRQSAWSNTALRAGGPALQALLGSELALAAASGWHGDPQLFQAGGTCSAAAQVPDPAAARVQVLTEGAIRAAVLERLGAAVNGDGIDLAMFALADRTVLEALLDAARRGVRVRLLLDPNEDATTLLPSGMPNQPAASELVSRSAGRIQVRWYRTHGERFHGAVALVYGPTRAWLTAGSANFTRRSLGDYDLDANLGVELPRSAAPAQQAATWFETLWDNRAPPGIEYTADFAAFADPSQGSYWLFRFLEGAGFCAF
jgi:phosphatidylserine/phosphatidylglycerophosphate/cardiolipin synthase-like enzyme